jgi:putative component of toxin-antitoxin plasmid stabilization module
VYYAQAGEAIVLLHCGGLQRTQSPDIIDAVSSCTIINGIRLGANHAIR